MKKQNKVEEIKRSRLTKEQRIELLHQVYDESLIYCATASMDNEFKGTAAAMLMVTRSREELVAMGDMSADDKKVGYSLGFLPDEDTDAINA
jgi:hypothetical protein